MAAFEGKVTVPPEPQVTAPLAAFRAAKVMDWDALPAPAQGMAVGPALHAISPR
jgi:hypothetical protein